MCRSKWLASVVAVVAVLLATTHLRSVLQAMFQRDGSPSTDCHEYSPAYPSSGGGGCSPKCLSVGDKQNSSYAAVYYNSTHRWPSDLLNNMHYAGDILKGFGPVRSLDTERKCYLHVTLDYFCCYSLEAVKIGEFIDKYDWRVQEVRFDRLVCAIHGIGGMVSLVLMLDNDSQARLLQYTLNSEREFERSTGIRKHIPHTKLQGFHMTLATVNQSLFPVQPAVDKINKIIPPGTWHSKPVILNKPECRNVKRSRTCS